VTKKKTTPKQTIEINGTKIPIEIKTIEEEAKPVIVRPPAPPLFGIVSMKHSDPDYLPLPENGPYYVMAKNRDFVHKQTHFGRVLVEATGTALRDTLAVLEEKPDYKGFLWHDIPKLPAGLIGQAWSFFRQIYLDIGTEAMVYITWHAEKGYRFFIPPQENTGGKVDSKFNPEHITDGWKNVGTIHSHCNFGAFHSGTDTGDADNQDGLHITIGHVNQDKPSTAVMLAFNKIKWDLELSDITEGEPELVQHPRWWERYVKKATGQISWEAAASWKADQQQSSWLQDTKDKYKKYDPSTYQHNKSKTWGYNPTTQKFRVGNQYYDGRDVMKTALAMINENVIPNHYDRAEFEGDALLANARLQEVIDEFEDLGMNLQFFVSYDEDLRHASERIFADNGKGLFDDDAYDAETTNAIITMYGRDWSPAERERYRLLSGKPLHSLTQAESDWLLEKEEFDGIH
jgi:hypothetical protein